VDTVAVAIDLLLQKFKERESYHFPLRQAKKKFHRETPGVKDPLSVPLRKNKMNNLGTNAIFAIYNYLKTPS
jgi:hypothetical protein